jgi:WhiB family redox-sensing transcriptional regulator
VLVPSGGAHPVLPTRPVPYPSFDGTQPCRDMDPELFFPVTSKESWYHPRQTKPVCAECPFLTECRDYAISYAVAGFWGGMSEPERRKERERLGIAPIQVAFSDQGMVRRQIAEIDDGQMSAPEIAIRVGCSPETIHRMRRRRQGAA